MNRENGFYRVLLNDEWIIAEYLDGYWYVSGIYVFYLDSDFQKIDKNKINSQP